MLDDLNHGSLRRRLTIGMAVWITGALLLTGLVLNRLFADQVSRQFDAELSRHLEQLIGQLELDSSGRPTLRDDLSDPRFQRPLSGLYWQVDDIEPGGTVARLRSRSLWDGALALPKDTVDDGQPHWHEIEGPDGQRLRLLERRVYVADAPDTPLRLSVAAPADLLASQQRDFAWSSTMALGLLALTLVAAAAMQLMAALQPLRRLRDELVEVRAGHASAIVGRFPDEIQPLVDEFNLVLSEQAASTARARAQAGNLAHALKTPLTILANASRSESPQQLAKTVEEQVAVARRQVEIELARARAIASAGARRAQLRSQPAAVAANLLRVMQQLHSGRVLSYALQTDDPTLWVRADGTDLSEMLGNLLDNACKWARSRVVVSVRADNGRVVIEVDDDGVGLSPEQRRAVLARGVRADERMPGSGLGLSIVSELALLHDGELDLHQAPGGGLRARLCLPETAAPVERLSTAPIHPESEVS